MIVKMFHTFDSLKEIFSPVGYLAASTWNSVVYYPYRQMWTRSIQSASETATRIQRTWVRRNMDSDHYLLTYDQWHVVDPGGYILFKDGVTQKQLTCVTVFNPGLYHVHARIMSPARSTWALSINEAPCDWGVFKAGESLQQVSFDCIVAIEEPGTRISIVNAGPEPVSLGTKECVHHHTMIHISPWK